MEHNEYVMDHINEISELLHLEYGTPDHSNKKDPLDEVVIIEEKREALPKIRIICPKCGNKEAVWWMQQTRSTDEPPTLFFRCTKCKHSWREY